MLIDFCQHSVRSAIKTDRVSFDGYEVQNLVSSNPELKRKGFLSDHFIKPPVNITVQFPCNVSIYRIIIDPVVGQQKTCDLKIFTASEKMTDSWLYHSSCDRKVKTDGLMFNYAGSVTQVEPTVVCFINNQFKERNSWRIETVPDVKCYPCVAQLNARKPGGLCNASHITICLSRSKGGKSVALKKLEIWGIPAVKVPLPVQNTLKNTFISSNRQRESFQQTASQNVASQLELTVDKGSNEANQVLIDGVSVPDDYIDQITFNIMTIPILLPCGKNIDQTTLERFVNTEASWGRPPSDPFTGVVFSQGSGPVTNTSLKARIDLFVLKHSNSLKVPQTLGHSDVHKVEKNVIVSSKLVSSRPVCDSMCKFSVPRFPADKSDSFKQVKEKSETRQDLGNVQSRFLKTNDPGSLKKKYTDEILLQSGSKRKSSVSRDLLCIDLTGDTKDENEKKFPAKKQKLQTSDHSSDLSTSLDSALLSTLGNLPSFTKISSKQSSVDTRDSVISCSKCKSNLTKTDVIKYRTSCDHFICRSCLVKEDTSFVCNVCFSQCQSSETVRVF